MDQQNVQYTGYTEDFTALTDDQLVDLISRALLTAPRSSTWEELLGELYRYCHEGNWQHSRRTQSRIDAVDLVNGAAVVPEVSEADARGQLFGRSFLIMAVPTVVAAWIWGWLWLLTLLPVMFLAAVIADRADGDQLVERLHERKASRRRLPAINEAGAGSDTTASGIRAGTWVCIKEEYQRVRRKHKATYGREVADPDVPYRMVVATFPLDGNQQVVAFSDGRSVVWHRASGVIWEECPELRTKQICLDDQAVGRTATALEDVIRFLGNGEARSVSSIVSEFGEQREPEIRLALEAAAWWKLIRITQTATAERRLTSDGATRGQAAIQLTEAGQDWHLAPEFSGAKR